MQKLPNWLLSKELRDAVNSRTPFYIPNAVATLSYKWDDVIELINMDKQLTRHMKAGGFLIHFLNDKFQNIVDLAEQIQSVFPSRTGDMSVHLYGSLSKESGSHGRHKDTANVFFIQGSGITKFAFDDGSSYNLYNGDLLYIPKGLQHKAIPLSKRISISVPLNKGITAKPLDRTVYDFS